MTLSINDVSSFMDAALYSVVINISILNPLTPVPPVTARAETHPQFPVPPVTAREKACEDNCLSYPP